MVPLLPVPPGNYIKDPATRLWYRAGDITQVAWEILPPAVAVAPPGTFVNSTPLSDYEAAAWVAKVEASRHYTPPAPPPAPYVPPPAPYVPPPPPPAPYVPPPAPYVPPVEVYEPPPVVDAPYVPPYTPPYAEPPAPYVPPPPPVEVYYPTPYYYEPPPVEITTTVAEIAASQEPYYAAPVETYAPPPVEAYAPPAELAELAPELAAEDTEMYLGQGTGTYPVFNMRIEDYERRRSEVEREAVRLNMTRDEWLPLLPVPPNQYIHDPATGLWFRAGDITTFAWEILPPVVGGTPGTWVNSTPLSEAEAAAWIRKVEASRYYSGGPTYVAPGEAPAPNLRLIIRRPFSCRLRYTCQILQRPIITRRLTILSPRRPIT